MAFDEEVLPKKPSSNIRAIQYDGEAQTMRIHFHGGRAHDYPNTSAADFDAQRDAESWGKHHHAHHRHRPNSRVEE